MGMHNASFAHNIGSSVRFFVFSAEGYKINNGGSGENKYYYCYKDRNFNFTYCFFHKNTPHHEFTFRFSLMRGFYSFQLFQHISILKRLILIGLNLRKLWKFRNQHGNLSVFACYMNGTAFAYFTGKVKLGKLILNIALNCFS